MKPRPGSLGLLYDRVVKTRARFAERQQFEPPPPVPEFVTDVPVHEAPAWVLPAAAEPERDAEEHNGREYPERHDGDVVQHDATSIHSIASEDAE